MAVGTAHQEKIAGRVHSHLVDHLFQGDEFSRPGGHGYLFSAALERDKLHEQHLEDVLGVPQRLQDRLHARNVTVVIGTPKVDQFFVPAANLVLVVRDVGTEIGFFSGLLDDHPVLVVVKRRRLQPHRPFFLVDEVLLPEPFDRLVHRAVAVQALLAEPAVVFHPEILQVLFNSLQHGPARVVPEKRQDVLFRLIQKIRPVPVGDLPGDVLDVTAPVVPFLQCHGFAVQLLVPQPGGEAQVVHLVADVIDVILGGNVVAGFFQEPRQGVADGGAPAVPHVEGPGGIGADKFQKHFFLASHFAFPEPGALPRHLLHPFEEKGRRHPQVDEPGAGRFGGIQLTRPVFQMAANDLGDLLRVFAFGFGHHHGQIGRKIPELFILGFFDHKLRHLRQIEFAPGSGFL